MSFRNRSFSATQRNRRDRFDEGAPRHWFRLALLASTALVAVPVAAILDAGTASAQSLSVDSGNSPYSVTNGTNSFADIRIGDGSDGTVNQSGGTLEAINGGVNVTIGHNSTGTLNLSGGTFSGAQVQIGFQGTGIVNQTGGAFIATNGINLGLTGAGSYTVTGGTVTGGFYLGQGRDGTLTVSGTGFVQADTIQIGAGTTGTVNLDGGTISAQHVTTNAGLSTMNFNGGTLQASASSAAFMQGLNVANVRDGGAVIDTNGFGVTIAQALVHSTVGGDAAVDGGLTKSGTGTLTLTGTNTYTGTTTISAGTLALSGAGSIATSGGVINNGIFDISATTSGASVASLSGSGATELGAQNLTLSNASGTLSGIIDGSGGLIVQAGAVTLSGINAYTGATTVDGGRLSVNGSIAASTLTTVNTGATLGGTGTVGNTTIASGGTLAPGNSIGTLAVQGNLTFNAGSNYTIEVSPTSADRTNVSGTAALAGIVNASYAAGAYTARQYTILNAAGGLTSTFSGLVNTGMPASISAALGYDANNVFLNLTLNFAIPGSGLNTNQQNVGNALTNYFNTTGGIPTAFATLSASGLTQVSGETATGSQQVTFDAMNQFMGIMSDPYAAGRDAATANAMGYADEGTTRSRPERDAYAMFAKAPPQVLANRWNSWAAGFGGSRTTDGNGTLGSNSTTSRIYGAAVGADYWFSPATVAGFSMAGGGTSFSVANGGSGRSDLAQAGAFVRHSEGATYVTAAAAYGWQSITTDRRVVAGVTDQLHAAFKANAYSGRVETGHRWLMPALGGIGVTSYAGVQVTAFDLPAYAETSTNGAATFGLTYAGKTVTNTRTELGLRSDKSFALNNALLTLRGRAAWAHDFSTDRSIAATFQALPGAGFTVNGAAQALDAALTSASAEMKWSNGWAIAGTFDGEFSGTTRSYAGKGVVRYAW